MADIDLEIRAPTAAELPEVVALLITQLREHHNELDEGLLARAAEGVFRRPQRGQFLIARAAGELVGFAALSYLWTLERGGRAGWLDELYVVPARRGHGIGAALLGAALETAREAGALALDLEIDADHQRAAALYQRAGFTPLPRTRWARALDPRSAAGTTPTALDGGCFCRAVRYHIGAAPLEVGHCHCTICRRTTGAPFVTWATVSSTVFAFTGGTPAELHSTPNARRTFCRACGTALTFQSRAQSDLLDVTVGSLDDPNALAPALHIWTSSQLAWLHLDDDLPRHRDRGPDWG